MCPPFDVERPGSRTYRDGLITRGFISIGVVSVYQVLPVDVFTLKDVLLKKKGSRVSYRQNDRFAWGIKPEMSSKRILDDKSS